MTSNRVETRIGPLEFKTANFEIAVVDNDRDFAPHQVFPLPVLPSGSADPYRAPDSYLVFDDQFVLSVNRDLNIVSHPNMRVRRHRPTIGVGERDLILARVVWSSSASIC